MKKILLILVISALMIGCVCAADTININNVEFEIPEKYSEGELDNNQYRLDNIFSIRCVDDNVAKAIGLWASECESSEDLNIGNHPVRHFCQYNKYVDGNHSHAYFVSNESVYEISWKGKEIDSDIEKLIKNTPKSEIKEDDFYNALDKSLDIYKEQKKDKLNQESEYNYIEAKNSSQQDNHDDSRFKQILLTYYYSKP